MKPTAVEYMVEEIFVLKNKTLCRMRTSSWEVDNDITSDPRCREEHVKAVDGDDKLCFLVIRNTFGVECEVKGAKGVRGNADYSLYYEEMEPNLVIVEANCASNGLAQLLGYMGIIYHRRENKGKSSKIMYRLSTAACLLPTPTRVSLVHTTLPYAGDEQSLGFRSQELHEAVAGLDSATFSQSIEDKQVISHLAKILTKATCLSLTATRIAAEIHELRSSLPKMLAPLALTPNKRKSKDDDGKSIRGSV
ncbi:hypothetical protein BDW62DRAFT_197816 [Aspergillus aurantiobrunneus]